jgi:hypothetical protein
MDEYSGTIENGLISLRQPKRFNDLDTEADGLDFGCSSNAITGSAEVSTRQETVMRPGNNLGDHPPWHTQCEQASRVTCQAPSLTINCFLATSPKWYIVLNEHFVGTSTVIL